MLRTAMGAGAIAHNELSMSLARRALNDAKGVVRRNYMLKCTALLIANAVDALRYRMGYIATHSGTIHASFDVQGSVDYVKRVVDDYKHYAHISAFHGRVAEIGPGDNCGVGMLIAADGADSVDLVDRYYSERDAERQSVIYRRLLEEVPALASRFADADLTNERTFRGLTRHYGRAASAEEFFLANGPYDFIVSRAVMEHLYDPELGIARMTDALAAGGCMMHAVDFRDHGMFTPHYHELKFLSVSQRVYAAMTRDSGRPNRILIHRYRDALDRAGVSYELLVTGLVGVGPIQPYRLYREIPAQLRQRAEAEVERVRHTFGAPFRDLPAADLAVNGIFLVARKSS